MNKELQDLAWSVLPKEFKEEVKKYYRTLHEQYKEYDGLHFETAKAKVQERIVTLQYFFGHHNLTSDAEGEEMLTCEKSKVQEMYALNEDILFLDPTHGGAKLLKAKLQELFGSKCQPDKKPKFKRCDSVVTPSGTICIIEDTHFENGGWLYLVGEPSQWVAESDLEPYVEPIPPEFGELKSQLPDSQLRLKIAAMAMQGLLASPVDANMQSKSVDYITDASFEYADALISKNKKGNLNENN